MLTSVAISLNAAPGSGPSLPSTVAQNWIFDFKRLALQDILAGRFGAQRHSLSSYAMMYRLDVAPEVLRRAVGLAEGESEAVREQYLSFNELIEQAKVWLSFDAGIVKVCACFEFEMSNVSPDISSFSLGTRPEEERRCAPHPNPSYCCPPRRVYAKGRQHSRFNRASVAR